MRILGEIILEELLDWAGTWRAGDVEGGSVAVVDGVDEVGGGDHIEVEVDGDFLELFWSSGCDVAGGAHKADFFSGPEAEADGVIYGEGG